MKREKKLYRIQMKENFKLEYGVKLTVKFDVF
jgi:hypothetical protein